MTGPVTEWLKLLRHKEEQKVRFKFLVKVSGWILVLLGGKGGQVRKNHLRMSTEMSLGVCVTETPVQRCPLSCPVHDQLLIFMISSWCCYGQFLLYGAVYPLMQNLHLYDLYLTSVMWLH